MATTTPNFGWPVPTSTDLVKDGATAIEALGDSIDASLLDLKGGTSGQVLSKNSNTDMDFTWVAQDDSNAIQNTIVDAKGDLIAASAADTPARLAVGTNGQVLTADSTAGTGLAWATPSSGSMTTLASGSLSGNSLSLSSISGSYKNLVLVMRDWYWSGVSGVFLRFNGDTASNYQASGYTITTNTTSLYGGTSSRIEPIAGDAVAADNNNAMIITIYDYANTSSKKLWSAQSGYYANGNVNFSSYLTGTWMATPAAVNAISVAVANGSYSYSGGTYILYGVN